MKRFWLLALLLVSCTDKQAIQCTYEDKERGSHTTYYCSSVGIIDGELSCYNGKGDSEFAMTVGNEFKCYPLDKRPHSAWYETLFD